MDFMKFWQLVEKYPWLPRILVAFNDMLKDPDISYEVVEHFLTPRAVTKGIKYIAFRPWEKLDSSLTSTGSYVELETNNQCESFEGEVYFVCYWHKTEGRPFSLEISNFTKDDVSIGQLIEEVSSQGGIIDVVVRVIATEFETGPSLKNEECKEFGELLQMVLGLRQVSSARSYELFLPPNK